MEIIQVKTGKRGRPKKMVKLDDGTTISYKEYVAKNKLAAKETVTVTPVSA